HRQNPLGAPHDARVGDCRGHRISAVANPVSTHHRTASDCRWRLCAPRSSTYLATFASTRRMTTGEREKRFEAQLNRETRKLRNRCRVEFKRVPLCVVCNLHHDPRIAERSPWTHHHVGIHGCAFILSEAEAAHDALPGAVASAVLV